VNVESRAGPDLEVALEEHGALVHADHAFAPMDGIGRIGVDECAGLDQHRPLGLSQHFGRRRRRGHQRKEEESQRKPEASAETAADQKDNETARESAYDRPLSDRTFDDEEYARAAADVTGVNPRLAAGAP